MWLAIIVVLVVAGFVLVAIQYGKAISEGEVHEKKSKTNATVRKLHERAARMWNNRQR